jgi:hypothetical protein
VEVQKCREWLEQDLRGNSSGGMIVPDRGGASGGRSGLNSSTAAATANSRSSVGINSTTNTKSTVSTADESASSEIGAPHLSGNLPRILHDTL